MINSFGKMLPNALRGTDVLSITNALIVVHVNKILFLLLNIVKGTS